MRFTTKNWMTAAAVILSIVAFAPAAGAISLSYGDSLFIGSVIPPEPASEALEAGYIKNLIGVDAGNHATIGSYDYNRDDSTFDCTACPDPDASTASKTENPQSTTNIDVSGWTYLLAKYDGPNGGDLVWNISGLGVVSFPKKWNPDDPFGAGKYGISHFTLFNPTEGPTEGPGDGPSEGPLEGPGDGPSEGPVPEPASLLLFGTALSAFGVRLRRAMR